MSFFLRVIAGILVAAIIDTILESDEDDEDVAQDAVDCPDCGQSNCHNFTLNVDLTSQIDGVEIKE